MEAPPQEEEEEEIKPPVEYALTSRGRRITKKTYTESASEDDLGANGLFSADQKNVKSARQHSMDDEDEDAPMMRTTRRRNKVDDFIVSDEEDKPIQKTSS
jgi:hypothetical protein